MKIPTYMHHSCIIFNFKGALPKFQDFCQDSQAHSNFCRASNKWCQLSLQGKRVYRVFLVHVGPVLLNTVDSIDYLFARSALHKESQLPSCEKFYHLLLKLPITN